jgi:hypothetical protein
VLEKVIKKVEKQNLEGEVRRLCAETWAEVQKAITVKRKNRYAGTEQTGLGAE